MLLLFSSHAFNQVEDAQVGAQFQEISKTAGRQIQGLESYSSNEVKGSQFFYSQWTTGSVTTIKNEVLNKGYVFLYDKVHQDLYMKWKSSPEILLADKPSIKGFSLEENGVTINFLSAHYFNPNDTSNFYQVLASNANYTLLKLTKTTFQKADMTDMEKVKDGDINDEFVDNITYYISYNNEIPKQITTKEKSIEKAFPELKQKISDFYNIDVNSRNSDQFLMSFMQSLN